MGTTVAVIFLSMQENNWIFPSEYFAFLFESIKGYNNLDL